MGFFKKLFCLGCKKTKPEAKPCQCNGDSITDLSHPETDEAASKGTFSKEIGEKPDKHGVRRLRGLGVSARNRTPTLSPRNLAVSSPTHSSSSFSNEKKRAGNASSPVDLGESVTSNASSHVVNRKFPAPMQQNNKSLLLLPTEVLEGYGDYFPHSISQNCAMLRNDDPKIRFSAGQIKLIGAEDVRSEGESSSFNFSIDAEDHEYEALRRRIGMMPANAVVGAKSNTRTASDRGNVGQGSQQMSTKPVLQLPIRDTTDVVSPKYSTNDGEFVFPILPSDGVATRTDARPGGVKDLQPRSLLGGAPYPDPDDEHVILRGKRQRYRNRLRDETTTNESRMESVKEVNPRLLLGRVPYPDPEDEHDVLRGHRQQYNATHFLGDLSVSFCV